MFHVLKLLLIIFIILIKQNHSAEYSRNKNVVFVIADDLRPAISGYKDPYAKTPNIDKFMKKSFYFNRAYCQQSLCAPSRNSMLTGRRPETIRLFDFYSYWRTFAGNFTTLPQYLKENGYKTYSIGKIFHPGISSNFTDDYPLSWTNKPFHPRTEIFMNSPVCPNGSGQLKMNLICPIRVDTQPCKTLPDIESMLEAQRFLIEEQNSNETNPFFLAIGFHKPHIPFKFPLKYLKEFPIENFINFTSHDDNYKPYGMPNVAWNPYTDIRKRDDFKSLNLSFPFGPIPDNLKLSIRQGYYSSVSYIDHLFGEIIKVIDLENTIVILTSDHGWSLGEHAEWAKYSNFEIALRVPLIVYTPEFKINNGKEITNIVELIDLFPSIIDLIGLPKIQKCHKNMKINQKTCTEGNSFYEIFRNRYRNLTNCAFSQYPRPSNYPKSNSDKPKLKDIKIMGYSMRTSKFRYTLWVEYNATNFTKNWTKIYGEELYDHRIDNNEYINLVGRKEFGNLQKRLQQRLIKNFA